MSCEILLLNGQNLWKSPWQRCEGSQSHLLCHTHTRQGRCVSTPGGLSRARAWGEQCGHTASSRPWDKVKAGGVWRPCGVCTQLWGCLGAALCVRSFWKLGNNSEICGSSVGLYLSWMYSSLIRVSYRVFTINEPLQPSFSLNYMNWAVIPCHRS